jgi:hypothetical protein
VRWGAPDPLEHGLPHTPTSAEAAPASLGCRHGKHDGDETLPPFDFRGMAAKSARTDLGRRVSWRGGAEQIVARLVGTSHL